LPETTGLVLFSPYVLLTDFFKLIYHRLSTLGLLRSSIPTM
jgi:hypothetical protein